MKECLSHLSKHVSSAMLTSKALQGHQNTIIKNSYIQASFASKATVKQGCFCHVKRQSNWKPLSHKAALNSK